MSDTVYMVGAGINRELIDRNGFRPPLARDVIQQGLTHGGIGTAFNRAKLEHLFNYIERFWKLRPADLEKQPFDIEECFTMLALQRDEAQQSEKYDEATRLSAITRQLVLLLASVLSETQFIHPEMTFEHGSFTADGEFKPGAIRQHPVTSLAKRIVAERATVLTFNYDTILEAAIDSEHGWDMTGMNQEPPTPDQYGEWESDPELIPDEFLAASHRAWRRPSAYGVQFENVQLPMAGPPIIAPGKPFYAQKANGLVEPPFLKLHGSLDWFLYEGPHRFENWLNPRAGQTLYYGAYWSHMEMPDELNWHLQPIIVTPVLHKRLETVPLIPTVWSKASAALAKCRRLIIGGYSFPATDFHVRRLLLEAFADNTLEELIVINPDSRVVQIAKDLCHFHKPVLVCSSLAEYAQLEAEALPRSP
jgi:hypothetical protein